MKEFLNWKRILVFVIVCGGLILLTHSFMMSAGILLVLLVIDRILATWEQKRREANDDMSQKEK